MIRYCLVKVGTTADGKVTGMFSAKRATTFIDETIWTPKLDDPGIIWYSNPDAANQHLLSANECILGFELQEIEEELKEPRKIGKPKQEKTDIPLPQHGKGSKYDMAIRKFVNSGEKEKAITENFGVTHTTVVRGLKRYADLFDYPVEVVDRLGTAYLVRKEKKVPDRMKFACVGVFS